jgi:hypothetical protein
MEKKGERKRVIKNKQKQGEKTNTQKMGRARAQKRAKEE